MAPHLPQLRQIPLHQRLGLDMNPIDTIRHELNLVRNAIGFALAEKNIPHEPQWTTLVPGSLDRIETALKRLETNTPCTCMDGDKLIGRPEDCPVHWAHVMRD